MKRRWTIDVEEEDGVVSITGAILRSHEDGKDRQFYTGKKFRLATAILAGYPNQVEAGAEVEVSAFRFPTTLVDGKIIGISVCGRFRFVSPDIMEGVEHPAMAGPRIDPVVEHHGDDSDGSGLV